MVGTISVRAGKPGRKTGVSKLTVTVQIPGRKKITLKGATSDGAFAAEAGGMALTIQLGASSLVGTFGPYELDGSRDMFTTGDSALKAKALLMLKRWLGNYAMAWSDGRAAGWNALSVSIRKKGRVKMSGTLADGTRIISNTILLAGRPRSRSGVKAQMLLGDRECAVALSFAKNGASASCLLWFCEDGSVECAGLPAGTTALAAQVAADARLPADAAFRIDTAALAAAIPGLLTELLPDGADIRSAKKGPSKLKITHKAKSGLFTGTFKIFSDGARRTRSITARFTGVVIGGVGYGTARAGRDACCAVQIKPEDEH